MKKLFPKWKYSCHDEKDAIKKINSFYRIIRSLKKNEVSHDGVNLSLKAVWQFECFIQLNLYRFIDLVEESSVSFTKKQYSSTILATRSAMEIAAMFYDVIIQANRLLNNKNYVELEELLYSRLFGSKNDPPFAKSVNVITIMEKVEKDIAGYYSDYKTLCDYCHPSFLIYSNFYGNYLESENTLVLSNSVGKNNFNLGLIIKPLAGAFRIYLEHYEDIDNLKKRIYDVNWKRL